MAWIYLSRLLRNLGMSNSDIRMFRVGGIYITLQGSFKTSCPNKSKTANLIPPTSNLEPQGPKSWEAKRHSKVGNMEFSDLKENEDFKVLFLTQCPKLKV
jgi:hypothetical protein